MFYGVKFKIFFSSFKLSTTAPYLVEIGPVEHKSLLFSFMLMPALAYR